MRKKLRTKGEALEITQLANPPLLFFLAIAQIFQEIYRYIRRDLSYDSFFKVRWQSWIADVKLLVLRVPLYNKVVGRRKGCLIRPFGGKSCFSTEIIQKIRLVSTFEIRVSFYHYLKSYSRRRFPLA